MMNRKWIRGPFGSAAAGIALLALASCSTSAVQPARERASSVSIPLSESAKTNGVIQLRPLIQPPGAAFPTCPVGEYLGTCTAQLDFSSWYAPASKCPRNSTPHNPPTGKPIKMLNSLGTVPMCASLAPASFVVSSAASINSSLQPLNGQPGIEIVLPPSEVSAYDAAMAASFRRPIAVVANGKIVYVINVEPNAAVYMPIGPLLIVYAASGELLRIRNRLQS